MDRKALLIFAKKLLIVGAPIRIWRMKRVLAHEASSSGASSFVDKPDWQSLVYGASTDDKRDIPDVSVFGGSYANKIYAIVCTVYTTVDKTTKKSTTHDGCADLAANKSDYSPEGMVGTSLSTPMFAGIQALVNQKEKGR
ncbi:hypothetical protein [Paraburkholderia youngii]|uniref:hypothetical protein n=1 Tax=Paraburkholderia youngii TaxID=2782701 RepID=UPI003D2229A4